jgi:hypothetical protein
MSEALSGKLLDGGQLVAVTYAGTEWLKELGNKAGLSGVSCLGK